MKENDPKTTEISKERAGWGSYLKDLRHRRDKPMPDGSRHRITQADIAREVGLSPAYIGFLELGQRPLPQDAAQRDALARAYGLDPEQFEQFAALFGQGKDQKSRRGPQKKEKRPLATRLPKTPLEQLNWAFWTTTEHWQPTSRNLGALPVSTAGKLELVHLYEAQTGTKLVAPAAEAALSQLAPPPADDGKSALYFLDVLLVRELEHLLRDYPDQDHLPRASVIAAWLNALQVALASVESWKPNLPPTSPKTPQPGTPAKAARVKRELASEKM